MLVTMILQYNYNVTYFQKYGLFLCCENKHLKINLMKPQTQRGNILIVDVEDDIGRLLRYNLRTEGYEVHTYPSVEDIYGQDLEHMRMVVINGEERETAAFDFIRTMKRNPKHEDIPVLLCAPPSDDEYIIKVFDLGIDDLVYKPYSLREMLARINAVLRRYPYRMPVSQPKVIEGITIRHLGIRIDTTNHKVECDGSVLPLTKTEYSIFEYLVKNANNFYTRNQIFSEVWKDDSTVNVRIVDTNISRLRKKLGDASKSLVNRYGLGYAFVDKK